MAPIIPKTWERSRLQPFIPSSFFSFFISHCQDQRPNKSKAGEKTRLESFIPSFCSFHFSFSHARTSVQTNIKAENWANSNHSLPTSGSFHLSFSIARTTYQAGERVRLQSCTPHLWLFQLVISNVRTSAQINQRQRSGQDSKSVRSNDADKVPPRLQLDSLCGNLTS